VRAFFICEASDSAGSATQQIWGKLTRHRPCEQPQQQTQDSKQSPSGDAQNTLRQHHLLINFCISACAFNNSANLDVNSFAFSGTSRFLRQLAIASCDT
jgi:hypothetical protein